MKAIVFYAATGQGFKSPADEIVRELLAQGVEARSVDFYAELGMKLPDWFFKQGWLLMLRHPWIFRIIYRITDSPFVHFVFAPQIPSFRKRMAAFLAQNPADLVVSVHFLSTWLLAHYPVVMSGQLPFFGYNSDVLLSHEAYIQPRSTMYYVSTELGRQLMIQQGMAPEKVKLCGFPVNAKYKRPFASVSEERKKLGLQDMTTLLLTFGGEGIGDISLIQSIADSGLPIQIVAVCGRNEALKQKLEKYAAAHPALHLLALGFTTNLQDYLYSCDVSAGKAGLNTVFEAIYLKRPFMVTMAMANERHCAAFAVEKGYAAWPRTVQEQMDFLRSVHAKDDRYQRMLSALEDPPCGFSIESMVHEMLDLSRNSLSNKA